MLRNIYIIFFLLGLSNYLWAQTNDPCTAPTLTVGTSCSSPTAGSLNGFAISASITNCASTGDPQGFYTFIATDANMTIEVVGSATIDPVIDLLVGACGSLTNVDCQDGTGTGGTEVMNATGLTVGVTYTIAVYDYFGDNDPGATFDICVHGVSSIGNNCPNAVPLTIGVADCATAVDNSGSFDNSSSTDNPCSSSYNDDEYWYTITGTGDAVNITLSALGSNYIAVSVLDDCPSGSPNCIASEENGSSTSNIAFTTPVLTNGVTYYIAISTWASVSGTPDFCINTSAVVSTSPGGTDCGNLAPICTDVGLTFTAQTGVPDADITNPGNNYDCLSSQPNPTWYYLEIGVAGDIDMLLSANSDVDFALWGPFADQATATANCDSYGMPIDCSFNSSATENVNITGASVGEVYVLLITNYAAVVQQVTLQQNGGTGATNCGIICGVDAGTTNVTMSNTSSNNYVLCYNESVTLTTTGYTLPTAVDVAGLGYMIYTGLPTTGDPSTDPNWTGYFYTSDVVTETNSAANVYDFILANPVPDAGSNGVPSGQQIYLVPVTMDDVADIANGGADDNLGHDLDGDGCFTLGTPIEITYLDEITGGVVENCGTNVVITLSGGYPGFDPFSSYTVTNTGGGVMVQSGTRGEILTFTNLALGDVITVDVTDDGNGCTETITFTTTCATSSCDADAGNW